MGTTKIVPLLWGALSTACSVGLRTPNDSLITCATDAACPSGWVCNISLERCTPTKDNGQPAPAIVGEPRLDPTLLGPHGVATLSFNVSSPLGTDPVVTLQVGSGRPFTKDTSASANLHYVFTYAAAGQGVEPEKTSVPVIAVLTSPWGKSSGAIACGSLQFDYTPPGLVPGSASVQLVPDYPSTNPLSSVLEATNGTRVVVTFSLDEALGAESAQPTLVFFAAQNSDGALATPITMKPVSIAQSTYTYAATLSGAPPATFVDNVRLLGTPDLAPADAITDAVGNAAPTLGVATFTVDTQPPPVPDTALSDAIVLRRAPWGSESGALSPTLSLIGEAGALSAGIHHLAVYDRLPATVATRLGVVDVANDGSFAATSLASPDLPVVYVTAVDDAGNQSPATEVKDVIWTASLGGKQPFDTTSNPTTFLTTSTFVPSLTQSPATTTEPSAAGEQSLWPGEPGGVEAAGTYTWSRVGAGSSDAAPRGRLDAGMAYDTTTGMVLLFGGSDFSGALQDVWQWDTTKRQWIERASANPAPGVVGDAAMVFAGDAGQLVMLDGADAWAWNDGSSNWRPLAVASAAAPSSRTGEVVVYDSLRHDLLLFGGSNGSQPLNDLWELEPASQTWIERGMSSPAPAPREDAAAVFDSARGTLFVFGGHDAAGLLGDTWEWDPLTDTWTQLATAGPSARRDAAIAYDARRGKVVLVGGYDNLAPAPGNTYQVGDQWEWSWSPDGSAGSWQQVTPAGLPSARFGARMVFVAATGHMLLFGGESPHPAQTTGADVFHADLDEYDPVAQTWRQLGGANTTAMPPSRVDAAAAFDESTQRLVMAGGFISSTTGAPQVDDGTWALDLVTGSWTMLGTLPTDGSGSAAREDAAMVDEPALGHVIIYGGRYGSAIVDQLAELDGNSWTVLNPTNPPPGRCQAELAADPDTQTVLMFGGRSALDVTLGEPTLADLWRWDGTTNAWSQVVTTGGPPPSRAAFGMALDPVNRKLVIFGGRQGADCSVANASGTVLGDTWVLDLDSLTWSEKLPAVSPPAQMGQRMVFEPARGTVVMFAGQSNCNLPLSGIWEWDDILETWSMITASGAPSPRYAFALARDPTVGADVMMAGSTPSTGAAEAWAINLAPSQRPATIWQVPFVAAQPPAGASVLEISGSVELGGVGRAIGAGSPQSGGVLDRWDTVLGQWVQMETTGADVVQPSTVAWTVGLQRDLAGALSGGNQLFTLAMAPAAGSVNGTVSRVDTDYVETTVRYHLGPVVGWELDTDGDTEGWTAAGVSAPGAPAGGTWTMTLDQQSSALLSPPINLEAVRFGALQMRVQSSAVVMARWRWLREDSAGWDDTKSAAFTIPASQGFATVRVSLNGVAAWQGRITRLRLDLDATAGQSFAIDWIRVTD